MDLVHPKTYQAMQNMQNYGNEISYLMDEVYHLSQMNDFYVSLGISKTPKTIFFFFVNMLMPKNDVITRN